MAVGAGEGADGETRAGENGHHATRHPERSSGHPIMASPRPRDERRMRTIRLVTTPRCQPPDSASASRVGFEPTTKGLKVPCSATELPARRRPYHVQIGTLAALVTAPSSSLWASGRSPRGTHQRMGHPRLCRPSGDRALVTLCGHQNAKAHLTVGQHRGQMHRRRLEIAPPDQKRHQSQGSYQEHSAS
jgi:hypothetical protein